MYKSRLFNDSHDRNDRHPPRARAAVQPRTMHDLPDTPARSAYLALVQVHERLAGEASGIFRARGLSLSQFNALRILVNAPEGGVSCQHIAENLVHRVPDVTRLVDRLEKAGLVTRQRCTSDRRVVRVSITEQGRELCESFYPDIAAMHERQFEGVPTERVEQLDRLLREVLALHKASQGVVSE